MAQRNEVVWRLSGLVHEVVYNIGRKDRPFWQVIVKLDSGFVCLYVRREDLRKIAERLEVGSKIEASGMLTPHRDAEGAKKPLFLDPVEQLVQVTTNEIEVDN